MNKDSLFIILMLIWTIINLIWYGRLREREGLVKGTIGMVDHLCDSLAKSFGIDLSRPKEENYEKVMSNLKRSEDAPEDYEYSGVIHIFKRNGKKRERPIMVYQFRDKACYFEYDEDGKRVPMNHKEAKSAIERALKGEKVDNYKKYEIEQK